VTIARLLVAIVADVKGIEARYMGSQGRQCEVPQLWYLLLESGQGEYTMGDN
jgi:hypothetical protein